MNWKRIKVGCYIALIYWIPSTIVLLNILYGHGEVFSSAIDIFLLPGYIIGFGFAYVSSKTAGLLGQLLTLAILSILMLPFTYFFKIVDRNFSNSEMKDVISYMIKVLEQSHIRYELHEFSSGAAILDIWYLDSFFAIQINSNSLGFSEMKEGNAVEFTSIPDEVFYDQEQFKTRFLKAFETT